MTNKELYKIMNAKELYEYCVEKGWENLDIVLANDSFGIGNIYPLQPYNVRVIKRKIWEDEPEQEYLLIH